MTGQTDDRYGKRGLVVRDNRSTPLRRTRLPQKPTSPALRKTKLLLGVGHTPPAERMMVDEALSCSTADAPDTVEHDIAAFVERTGADEIMITCNIHDHAKRLRSFELVAKMMYAGHAH